MRGSNHSNITEGALDSSAEATSVASEWQFDEGQYDIECFDDGRPTVQKQHNKPQEPPRDTKTESPPRRKVLRVAAVFMTVGLIGMISYTFVIPNSKSLSASNSKSSVIGVNMSYISSIQEETPPTNYLADYKVSGSFPRYISVPILSLTARTIPVGVDGRGHSRLPVHSYDTGWYNASSKPGEEGVIVLSGMCTTPVTKGVFEELHNVSNGDEIVVERGDGVKIRYAVTYTEHVLASELDMTKVLHLQEGYKTGLSIVTCSGTYDNKTNDMSERLVVYAKQI